LSADEIKRIASNRLKIDDQDIILMYRSRNCSASSIALHFKCDVGTIIKRLRKYLPDDEYNFLKKNNHRRAVGIAAEKRKINLPDEQIVEAFLEGRRSYEIAETYKCSRGLIDRALRTHLSKEQIAKVRRKNFADSMSGVKHFRYIELPEEEIVFNFLAGMSSPDLAKKWECSDGKIKSILRRNLAPEIINVQSHKNISKKLKGLPKPESMRAKLRSQTGSKHPMFGKHWTKEQRINKKLTVRRGPMHHAWKGGISPASVVFIGTPEWKELAMDIRYRDNFTCKKCGKDHVAIVHHLIPRSSDPQKYFWYDSNNLITLCNGCHLVIEPKKWRIYPDWIEIEKYYSAYNISLPLVLREKLNHILWPSEP